MHWLPLSFIAPLIWGLSNLIDGHLIRTRVRDPLTLLAFTGMASGIPALFALAHGDLLWPGERIALTAALAGILSLLSYYPYYRALETAHPASAVLMWNLAPALIAVVAFVFLGERLAFVGYLAIVSLVGSALLASVSGRVCVSGSRRAPAWMALASVLVVAEAVVQKQLFTYLPFAPGFALQSITSCLAGLAILAVLPRVRLRILNSSRGTLFLVFLNEAGNLGAVVIASLAVSLGPVSLVKAVGGLQPLFVLVLARAAARRGVSDRDAERPRFGRSILATGLAILGLVLLGWG